MYYIISFRSRTNAIRFHDALEGERIDSTLINTPRQAKIGCGLSVKIRENDLYEAERVLSYANYSYTLFRVENGNYYQIS